MLPSVVSNTSRCRGVSQSLRDASLRALWEVCKRLRARYNLARRAPPLSYQPGKEELEADVSAGINATPEEFAR